MNIFLVDDEQDLCEIFVEVLQGEGHHVIHCLNAEQALKEFSMDADLLITDMNLPGMSGVQLAEMLLEKKPGIPVLFVSGYSQSEISKPDAFFLQKPFTIQQLTSKVEFIQNLNKEQKIAG